ncbi:MAG: translation initiation factor IF-6 [Candidatus Woesearchaeota archaeon]
MHILKTDINGNPNIGLYGFVTNKYCLLGEEISDTLAKKISDVLKVPYFKLNIAGTSLLGVFLTGNDDNLLIPNIAFSWEIEKIDKISKEIGFKYSIIDSELTALGNNIICNKNYCLVNPDYNDDIKKQIKKALDLDVKEAKIANLPTIGSLTALNDKGCAIHRDAEQFEIDFISDKLNISCETATVNMGNPFIKSGILVNNNGFVIGKASGGPEITYLDEIFGFLGDN